MNNNTNYDLKSTIIYALGVAIENEDDATVKAQLEELEAKVTDGLVKCDKAPAIPRSECYPVLTLSVDDATQLDDCDDNGEERYTKMYESLSEVDKQALADYVAEWMYDGDQWEEALRCGLENFTKEAKVA